MGWGEKRIRRPLRPREPPTSEELGNLLVAEACGDFFHQTRGKREERRREREGRLEVR